MVRGEGNPLKLARLLAEIDAALSELNSEVREILGEVASVIRTEQRRQN